MSGPQDHGPQNGGATSAAASFTVRGTRNGSLVAVTWLDGRLSGDYSTVDLIETYADMVETSYEDEYLGARLERPQSSGPRGLQNPVFAYELILRTIDSVRETTGPLAATVIEAAADREGA